MEGSLSVSCSRDSRRASSSSEDGAGMMLGELCAAKRFALRPVTSSNHCAEEYMQVGGIFKQRGCSTRP